MSLSIIITGTPGVGKTTLAKFLSKKLGIPYLDFARFALNMGLITGYDAKRASYEVDVTVAREVLSRHVGSQPYVIDSLIPDVLFPHLVKVVIVLRLDPWELALRLKARGWHFYKVRENVEAELLGVSLEEALGFYGDKLVRELNVTGLSVEAAVEILLTIIRGEALERYAPGSVNWLSIYDPIRLSKRISSLFDDDLRV